MKRWFLLMFAAPCNASAMGAELAQTGRARYHGLQTFAEGDAATTVRLPAEMVVCARRHGARGEGGSESGVIAPLLHRRHGLLVRQLVRCTEGMAFAITHDGTAAVKPLVTSNIKWLAADATLASRLRKRDRGCVGYTLAQADVVKTLVPSGWLHAMVLPLPAVLYEGAGEERGRLRYQRLGGLAATLTLELLGRAGAGLHERSLLEQIHRLARYELRAGVELHFSRVKRYGWEPQVLRLSNDVARDMPRTVTSMGGN